MLVFILKTQDLRLEKFTAIYQNKVFCLNIRFNFASGNEIRMVADARDYRPYVSKVYMLPGE